MNPFIKILKNKLLIVVLMLAVMAFLQISSVLQESQTIDEGTHLAAGYSYLVKHDFRMNPEHPPFIKELAALPLVIIKNKLSSPFNYPSWDGYDEWQFAKDLIYKNNIQADTIIFIGRLPTILLSLLLGIYVFLWAKELFGYKAGLVSLFFYILCPNILAHGRYITTDLGVTAFFFITIYYFYKYLKYENWKFLILTGIFCGLALASKFSAPILLPILFLLYLIKKLTEQNKTRALLLFKKLLTTFITIVFISGIIVWASYGFEVKKPLDSKDVQDLYALQDYTIASNTVDQQSELVKKVINYTDTSKNSGRTIRSILEKVPIPAFSYFDGLVRVYLHNYYGHRSYLLGNYSELGWWYYFPVAFLVKTPVTTQIFMIVLLIAGVLALVKLKIYRYPLKALVKIPIHWYLLIIPSAIFFGFSVSGHINLGLRHVLIVYPFIYVSIGYLASIIKKTPVKILFTAFLVYYFFTSILIYPNYLAYFNEISGGPGNGPKYLVDSNIDWGQDAKKLKKYMTVNNINHVCLSYFGQADLEYYKIDFRYLPTVFDRSGIKNIDCVVAISVTSLLSKEREYGWLLDYQPIDKIGYSIYVYDLRKK
ncbi:MAG: glycosyltransferase family 39 protein [Patescibacteria group bacterium]